MIRFGQLKNHIMKKDVIIKKLILTFVVSLLSLASFPM